MAQVIAVPYTNLHSNIVIQRYFAFFVSPSSLTLALNSSVDGGGTWTWQILSGGPGAGILSKAAATTFFSGSLAPDGTAINKIYAFAVGNDGNLWVAFSLDNGKTWSWQNQGVPAASIAAAPDAVSRQSVDKPGVFEQDTYCYVVGSDGNLYVNFSEDNGGSWHWASRGAPPTTTLAAAQPAVLSYFDGTHQSIYAFAIGQDGNLYANFGDGSVWNWQNLGQPLPGVSSFFPPSAFTIPPDAAKEIYVFVMGGDGNLYAAFSPAGGTGWVWENRGAPAAKIQAFFPNAQRVGIESKSAVFTWPVFVFAVTNNFTLAMDSSPDASLGPSAVWNWQDMGQPTGKGVLFFAGVVASTEVEPSLADVQIYAFALDIENDLHTLRWNGSTWSWFDQSGPP